MSGWNGSLDCSRLLSGSASRCTRFKFLHLSRIVRIVAHLGRGLTSPHKRLNGCVVELELSNRQADKCRLVLQLVHEQIRVHRLHANVMLFLLLFRPLSSLLRLLLSDVVSLDFSWATFLATCGISGGSCAHSFRET